MTRSQTLSSSHKTAIYKATKHMEDSCDNLRLVVHQGQIPTDPVIQLTVPLYWQDVPSSSRERFRSQTC
jgi:hypothetical protein